MFRLIDTGRITDKPDVSTLYVALPTAPFLNVGVSTRKKISGMRQSIFACCAIFFSACGLLKVEAPSLRRQQRCRLLTLR